MTIILTIDDGENLSKTTDIIPPHIGTQASSLETDQAIYAYVREDLLPPDTPDSLWYWEYQRASE